MFRTRIRRPVTAWLGALLALQISGFAHPAAAQSAARAATPLAAANARAVRRELSRAEAQLRVLVQGRAQPYTVIIREPQRLIQRIPAALLFVPDSATLREDAMDEGLGAVAKVMHQRRRLVAQIAVYTDDIGGANTNVTFSAQRAAAIVTALQAAKIGSDRLSAVGAGAAASLASNDAPEGRTQNRRVEIAFGLSLAALSAP